MSADQPTRDDALTALRDARDLLAELTPLRDDCGRRCGAACCQPTPGEESGMYLFPGEEALYPAAMDWAHIRPTAWQVAGQPVQLLVCGGACPRAQRPLACRVFPLVSRCAAQGVAVRLDPRAWPVCPLMPYGVRGLDTAFVAAVRAAFQRLEAHPAHRAFLCALDELLRGYTL